MAEWEWTDGRLWQFTDWYSPDPDNPNPSNSDQHENCLEMLSGHHNNQGANINFDVTSED